jgi:hypothetical protein
MNATFKYILMVILLALATGECSGTTYYMRSDGTAANKAAATSCGAVGTAMDEAGHNAETFSAGDIIYLCDDGGDYTTKISPPSSGSVDNYITYAAAPGDSPVVDVAAGENYGLVLGSGDTYIKVGLKGQGITFKGGTVASLGIGGTVASLGIVGNTANNNNHIVQYCTFSEPQTNKAGIRIANLIGFTTSDHLIQYNTFAYTGAATNARAILVAPQDQVGPVRIYKNTFTGAWASNIRYYEVDAEVNVTANERPYGQDIDGNTITDPSHSWIQIQTGWRSDTQQSYIRNNTMTLGGDAGSADVNGIQGQWLDDVIIENNIMDGITTTNCDGGAIIVDNAYLQGAFFSDGVIIRNNLISNANGTGCDGKGISVFRGKNTEVYYNIIYSSDICIKADWATGTGNVFYNNVCYDNTIDGIRVITGTPEVAIKNNIFLSNAGVGISVQGGATLPDESNNITYGNGTNYTGFTLDGTSLESDPLFVDAANENFRLNRSSPARDAGTDIYGANQQDYAGIYVTDSDGEPIYGTGLDIGAYEYTRITDTRITEDLRRDRNRRFR